MPAWLITDFFGLTALLIFIFRSDVRRQMLWSGLLAVPVISLQLISSNWSWPGQSVADLIRVLGSSVLASFFLGATASGLYEAFLRHYFTHPRGESRQQLIWLMIGPAFLLLASFNGLTFFWALLGALIAEVVVLLMVRSDLFWDVAFSGIMMGLLYLLAFIVNYIRIPTNFSVLWVTPSTLGLNIFGIPIEELALVVFFGALWGPIYVAVKDLHQSR